MPGIPDRRVGVSGSGGSQIMPCMGYPWNVTKWVNIGQYGSIPEHLCTPTASAITCIRCIHGGSIPLFKGYPWGPLRTSLDPYKWLFRGMPIYPLLGCDATPPSEVLHLTAMPLNGGSDIGPILVQKGTILAHSGPLMDPYS